MLYIAKFEFNGRIYYCKNRQKIDIARYLKAFILFHMIKIKDVTPSTHKSCLF